MAPDPTWKAYLDGFHEQHPGITDDVLGQATGRDGNAYGWLAAAVPPGRVLDLACGSGPLAPWLPDAQLTGVDLSAAELRIAAGEGRRVARADTTALPFPCETFDAAVCSMALQVLPWRSTLTEVRRAVRPGGLLIATVPSTGPLTTGDQLRYAGLLLRLGQRRLRYPTDAELTEVSVSLTVAGFDLVRDERERFALPAVSSALLVESLYLPGVPPASIARAQRLASRWKHGSIGVPIRRLVAVRR